MLVQAPLHTARGEQSLPSGVMASTTGASTVVPSGPSASGASAVVPSGASASGEPVSASDASLETFSSPGAPSGSVVESEGVDPSSAESRARSLRPHPAMTVGSTHVAETAQTTIRRPNHFMTAFPCPPNEIKEARS
jgi:hypothetical protein